MDYDIDLKQFNLQHNKNNLLLVPNKRLVRKIIKNNFKPDIKVSLACIDVLSPPSYAPRLDRGVKSSQDISGYRGQAAVGRDLDAKHQQPPASYNIYSIADYIDIVFNYLFESNLINQIPGVNIKYLITPWHREIILKNIISDNAVESLSVETILAKVTQAWSLVINWQLDYSQWDNLLIIESQLCSNWFNLYKDYLVKNSYCDPDQKLEFIIKFIEYNNKQKIINLSDIFKFNKIYLYGFDDISVLLKQLFEKLDNINIISYYDYDDNPDLALNFNSNFNKYKIIKLYQANTIEQEISEAIKWAYQHQQQGFDNIGIIVPNLSELRDIIIRITEDIIPDRNIWNISGGDSLISEPVIKSGIIILDLFNLDDIPVNNLKYLLKSGFIHTKLNIIDNLFLYYKNHGYKNLSALDIKEIFSNLDEFLLNNYIKYQSYFGSIESFESFENLEKTKDINKKLMLPSQWVLFISKLLKDFGWPSGVNNSNSELDNAHRTINSREYQALSQWQSSMQELSKLDFILGSVNYNRIIYELTSLLENTVFQIESDNNAIDILGMLEGAGLKYTSLWLLNITSDNWPSMPDPNPFIPIDIQKKYKLPHASSERELIYAKKLTKRYYSGSNNIVISYSKLDKEKENNLSFIIDDNIFTDTLRVDSRVNIHEEEQQGFVENSLLTPYAPRLDRGVQECLNIPGSRGQAAGGREGELNCQQPLVNKNNILKSYQDNNGPDIIKSNIKQGIKALTLQAECPFRSFAETRLGASKNYTVDIGPPSWLRGQVIHLVLEEIYKKFDTKNLIIDLINSDNYEYRLNNYIIKALNIYKLQYKNIFKSGVIEFENRLIFKLIHNWLKFDIQRNNFKIVSIEEKLLFKINNIQFNIRIDRIDLENDNLIIIDYKTTEQNINNLFKQDLTSLQLPIYSLLDKYKDVGAVLFAEIIEGNIKLNGITKEYNIPGCKLIQNWHELTTIWAKRLDYLASDYSSGNALVNPINANQTCINCHLSGLCRKDELCL